MNVIRVPVPSLQPGEHESNFHRMCALPMMMFEGRTEEHVLELATESVSACGLCHVEAAYLTEDDALTPSAINGQPDRDLQA